MTLPGWLLAHASPSLMMLAQNDGSGASFGVAWLLVLLALILGVLAAVRPDKREEEIKRPKA